MIDFEVQIVVGIGSGGGKGVHVLLLDGTMNSRAHSPMLPELWYHSSALNTFISQLIIMF